MHYHLEIILPPTGDLETAINTILNPFSEGDEENTHAFWDWFVIGGRFAGQKFIATLEKENLDKFYEWCQSEQITVSGLQAGKQELTPANQIPKVDAKWNELFPETGGKSCPLFNHSNNQYDKQGVINGDICLVGNLPNDFHCERLIIAAPSYSCETKDYTGGLEAVFMISQDFYNGVNFIDTSWNGNVSEGLRIGKKKFEGYTPEYKKIVTPKKDWLCVTVDYHT